MGPELIVGVLSAILRLKDETGPAIATAKANIAGIGSETPAALAPAAAAMENVKSGWVGMGQAAQQAEGVIERSGLVIGTAIGSFIGGALQQFGANFISTFFNITAEIGRFSGEILDLSAQTGIGAEQLQAFNYALSGSNLTAGQAATAISQLSKRLIEGNEGAATALNTLRISSQELISLAPDQAIIRILEAVKQLPSEWERNAVMMELFGRQGSQFLRLLNEDLRALEEEAKNNGAVISESLLRKADDLDDAWHRLMIRGKALLADVMIPMGQIIQTYYSGETAATIGQKLGFGDVDLSDALKKAQGSIPSIAGPSTALNVPNMKEAAAISKELTDKIREQTKAADELAKAHDRAFGLDHIANVKQTITAIGGLEGVARMDADAVKRLHDELGKAIDAAERNGKDVPLQWQQIYLATEKSTGSVADYVKMVGKIPEVYATIPPPPALLDPINTLEHQRTLALIAANPPGVVLQAAQHTGLQMGQQMMAGINSGLSSFGSNLIATLQGGGSIIQSFAATMGANFSQSMFGTSQFQSLITKQFGGAIGGMVNAILPGIGSLLGPLVGKIGSFFGGLFGRDEEAREVNPARDAYAAQFVSQFGGSNSDAVTKALEAAGFGGERASALVRQFNAADTMAKFNAAKNAIDSALASAKSTNRNPDLGTSAGGSAAGGSVINISITVEGGVYGADTDQFKDLITKATLAGLEKGGDNATKFRMLHDQLIPSLA